MKAIYQVATFRTKSKYPKAKEKKILKLEKAEADVCNFKRVLLARYYVILTNLITAEILNREQD